MQNKTPQAREAFAGAKLPEGEPVLPALGVWMLAGRDIQTKAWNLHRNLDENRVTLIECLAVKQ